MKHCKTCRFFSGQRCKRYPPQMVQRASSLFEPESVWPAVKEYDGCGEHQEMQPKKTARS